MGATGDHLERFIQRLDELARYPFEPSPTSLPLPITDPLTRLPNRSSIIGLAEREFRRRLIVPTPLALIVFDIDDFKLVNNSYLLPGADAALRQLGDLLADAVLSGEYVGRFGGDRFLVVAPDTNHERASASAERIRTSVKQASFIHRHDVIRITVSLGIAVVEAGMVIQPAGFAVADAEGGVSDELQPLIRSASAEMEKAKRRLGAARNDSRLPTD